MHTSAIPGMAVPQVIVPLRRLDRPALAALTFARSISADVTALFAIDDVVSGAAAAPGSDTAGSGLVARAGFTFRFGGGAR